MPLRVLHYKYGRVLFHSAWKQRREGFILSIRFFFFHSTAKTFRLFSFSFFFCALCSQYIDVRVLMWAVSYWDQTYCRPLPSFRKVLLMSRRGLNNIGNHPSGHTPYRSRWWLLLLLLRPSVKIKKGQKSKKTVRLFIFFYFTSSAYIINFVLPYRLYIQIYTQDQ